jgi:hypothetical protein
MTYISIKWHQENMVEWLSIVFGSKGYTRMNKYNIIIIIFKSNSRFDLKISNIFSSFQGFFLLIRVDMIVNRPLTMQLNA